jgi:hypothetical protein
VLYYTHTLTHKEQKMAYNRIKNIKETAEFVADMNGVQVSELDQEDIEYIGDSCQCAYADVAEILGLEYA